MNERRPFSRSRARSSPNDPATRSKSTSPMRAIGDVSRSGEQANSIDAFRARVVRARSLKRG